MFIYITATLEFSLLLIPAYESALFAGLFLQAFFFVSEKST